LPTLRPQHAADRDRQLDRGGAGWKPAEYGAGLQPAIDRGWLDMHESGTYMKYTQTGAELFA